MRVALLTGCAVCLIGAGVFAQRPPTSAATRLQAPRLPPVSMTCPMHPDVIEARPGTCPVCRMALVPVRLDGAWMCPVHTSVTETEPGTCRFCRRELVRVTVALTWACRGDSREHLEPGRCDDGSPRIGKRTLRPHGNHNPRHGGQFFMAPDNWHHLEGTYPRDRVFRLYVYDDYARPLPPAEMRRLRARVVTEETFNPVTRETRELKAFPLRPSRDGSYLEARLDAVRLPGEMTAKLRLNADAPEYRFDFTFTELSREPAPPAAAPDARRAAAPAASPTAAPPAQRSMPAGADAAAAPAASPGTTISPTAVAEPGPLEVMPIPGTMEGMVALLKTRTRQVGELIDSGNFTAVYVPAFQAKDLAIALEPHLAHLQPGRRDTAAPALERVVRTAWLLDAFGDVGNRQQLSDAYSAFTASVAAVVAAFEEGN